MSANPAPAQPERVLTEVESKRFFESAGMPVVETRLARTREESIRHAREIGLPVALKVISPEIVHKSDCDGVRLGLGDLQQVEKAWDEIMLSARARHPDARIEGVSVQRMAPPGREIIIGMSKDQELGPLMMFGQGGIMVEVMKDVSFRLVPMTAKDAAEMIRETKGYSLLTGFRGAEVVDVPFLEGLLLRVADLIEGHPEIKELDLNPVIAYSTGALVVDARIILEDKE